MVKIYTRLCYQNLFGLFELLHQVGLWFCPLCLVVHHLDKQKKDILYCTHATEQVSAIITNFSQHSYCCCCLITLSIFLLALFTMLFTCNSYHCFELQNNNNKLVHFLLFLWGVSYMIYPTISHYCRSSLLFKVVFFSCINLSGYHCVTFWLS